MNKIILSSVLAGIMISISSIVYLNTNPIVGSFLFSIGLLSILHLKLNLFTGKVPYIKDCRELPRLLSILVGNIFGCCLMFAFPSDRALEIITKTINTHPVLTFLNAILCNILIYIAVEAYKKNDTITVILLIAGFIIAGFDHSIARICLIISSRIFNIDIIKYILIVIIGNGFGGILFHRLREKINI